jgi:acetyl-CoA carboxylase carboxyltransferase component
MIEGGGLGVVAPADVGPMSVQVPNGVVDILVPDDETAVATARRYVSFFAPAGPEASGADQRPLRTLVPESRTRAYDVRPIAETLADEGSLLEVRAGFGAGMFVAGARLDTPVCTVVLREAYGLGAVAMAGGDLRGPALTIAWPTAEFGPMGLEGAVRLGYQRELRAIADPRDRQRRYQELVAAQYEKGKALSTATAFEIDDVIDPAATRALVLAVLRRGAAAR